MLTLEFIEPKKQIQNTFIERFNRMYSTAILDFNLFRMLNEVRESSMQWFSGYNCEPSHKSPNNLTPEVYQL
ncbi:integrase core domain-containing protein [Pantoea endophytica]